MIRFIFVALFLFLYLILGIPVYLVLRLICKINKKAGDYASLRLVQWAFRVILKISGTEITVIGGYRLCQRRHIHLHFPRRNPEYRRRIKSAAIQRRCAEDCREIRLCHYSAFPE